MIIVYGELLHFYKNIYLQSLCVVLNLDMQLIHRYLIKFYQTVSIEQKKLNNVKQVKKM
jgi:hypothetical protein